MTPPETRRIVLATNNAKKAAELADLLAHLPVELVPLREAVGAVDIVEPFATFRENAAHKALTVARLSGEWSLAEDSGLVVDALSGRPGVYSARFAGEDRSDEERIDLLLDMLSDVPPERRDARFRCEAALAGPGRVIGAWSGVCEGRIAGAPRGSQGFGYDPVFVPAGETRTTAEMTQLEKGAISHRGMAMRAFVEDLPGLLSAGR